MELKLKKKTDMKKLLAFIILAIALVSCYSNYIVDFTYTAIYFPNTIDVRTFVVGEGMKFDVGVALSGVHKNVRDRKVTYTLDNTLITPAILSSMQTSSLAWIKGPSLPVAALLPLPGSYYTITDPANMVIKAGTWEGGVTIRPDSVTFLNDSLKTIVSTYVMPFSLLTADADTILLSKKNNVVGVKFENMLFGNYWHGGSALVNRPAKADTTIVYRSAVNDPAVKIWTLTTFGPSTLYTNGYFNQTTAKNEMKLVLKGNTVYVSAATGSTFTIASDGASSYNRPLLLQNRKIFLKYKYTDAGSGYTYHCSDTLIFRNRFRDGVNEWQDENPAHYLK